ncbi:hypothetical protein PV08_03462 [Exophiala spinifera]|uniref:Uncharacterized protein n=1 Tax=Exophiala spinifera TaxID=91928 RepID=A0A0D2C6H0_9EURO|nr:uncharacterized protein PV08_03462 [Exophiala spinifera]KIW19169.1 hypothetical protein PV08_03462 [Exophiala spinifera]
MPLGRSSQAGWLCKLCLAVQGNGLRADNKPICKQMPKPASRAARAWMLVQEHEMDPDVAMVQITLERGQDYIRLAEEYIRVTMGQPCSRLGWRYAKLESPHMSVEDGSRKTPRQRHDSRRLTAKAVAKKALRSVRSAKGTTRAPRKGDEETGKFAPDKA